MGIKLYGAPQSTCTRRVALIAKECNIPYEVVAVNIMAGDHKQAAYKTHQPFGQVPYIIDEDGFELYESRAIARYLITKGSSTKLIPTEPKAYAKFEQAASVEYSQFDPYASGIANEKMFKAYRGQTTNEEHLKELISGLEGKIEGYEAVLGKQKYLAGNEVTLADLSHLPYGSLVFEHLKVVDLTKYPNVHRWWSEITSRPSWQAVKNGA